jgi:ERO1-like protein beta
MNLNGIILAEGDYFDLTDIPERYTGYSGIGPHRVWNSIYQENCFGLSEMNLMSGSSPSFLSLPDTMNGAFLTEMDGMDGGDMCLEKRVYYKVISGECNSSCRSVPMLICGK